MTLYYNVNSKIVEKDKSVVNINNRAFKYGDGVFETLRFENQKIYNFDAHLLRLTKALKLLYINFDLSDILDKMLDLIKINKLHCGFLRLQISRGSGGTAYLPDFNEKSEYVITISDLPKNDNFEPVDLWLNDYVKQDLLAYPVSVKTCQGLNSILAKIQAVKNNCFDGLLLDKNQYICETSSSNIFWIKGDILYTPSYECGILMGTIREKIIKLSDMKIKTGFYKLEDLKNADEIFLTNISYLVKPVKLILPIDFKYKNSYLRSQNIKKIIWQDIKDQCY